MMHTTHKYPKLHSFKVHMMLNDPRVQKIVNKDFKINREYNVPYLAGANIAGDIIYIDKDFHFIQKDGTNVLPFLIMHEKYETALMDVFKLNYKDAHHIATHIELEDVKTAGIDIHQYEKYFRKPIEQSEKERVGKAPPDLNIKPYQDEHDIYRYRKLGI